MENFEQIIKAMGLIAGALVPALQFMRGRYGQRPKHLQERYQLIKGVDCRRILTHRPH